MIDPPDGRSAGGDLATGRDDTIDALRGFAIAMMVFGHLAIEVIVPPGGFYIEALGGSAPAIFLMVSGMMVAHGVRLRGRPLHHFALRTLQVLGLAAALDLAFWRIIPFTTVDVLYLIALAVLVSAAAARWLPNAVTFLLAAAIILSAPPLQDLLGYTDWPTEIPLSGPAPEVIHLEGVGPVRVENPTSILNHWLVDGWFPVFPWLGMALFGVALSAVRWPDAARLRRFNLRSGLLPGAALLTLALALGWWDVDYELNLRRRWGGSFMPPGWDYLIGSVGLFLVLGWIVDRVPQAGIWAPLRLVGTNALLVYLVHFPLLRLIARALPHRIGHPAFWALYVGVLGLLCALVLAWRRLRGRRAHA